MRSEIRAPEVGKKDSRARASAFMALGYHGPQRILTKSECRRFLRAIGKEPSPPLDWKKGLAITQRPFYEVATHPKVLNVVVELLGEDVLLWGASIQMRKPGEVHPWHSDIESDIEVGATLAVWIGLENTTKDSSLVLVPHSHQFGLTIQEARSRSGVERLAVDNEMIAKWTHAHNELAELMQLEMTDGQAIFFDGKLWHGSDNVGGLPRRALLLQYATPDASIGIPDLNHLEWPFVRLDAPRAPCLLVRGSDRMGVNRIVLGPVATSTHDYAELRSRVYQIRLPLATDDAAGWKPTPIYQGSTADLKLACHASSLNPGHTPHPPHEHREEEILLLLDGEVELDLPDAPNEKRPHLSPGDFVYYPSGFLHTLTTVSERPANYWMLKWDSGHASAETTLPYGRYRAFEEPIDPKDQGYAIRVIFDAPTARLRKLQCHESTLMPGAGYDAHVDSYDVAVVVLEGEVETLGQRVGPHTVILYRAGERHGMSNPGSSIARYLVFELHGQASADALTLPPPFVDRVRRAASKLVHRGWRSKIKRALRR